MKVVRMRKLLNRVFLVLCYENRLRIALRRLLYCFLLFMKPVKQNGNECFLLFESVSHSERHSLSWNKTSYVRAIHRHFDIVILHCSHCWACSSSSCQCLLILVIDLCVLAFKEQWELYVPISLTFHKTQFRPRGQF